MEICSLPKVLRPFTYVLEEHLTFTVHSRKGHLQKEATQTLTEGERNYGGQQLVSGAQNSSVPAGMGAKPTMHKRSLEDRSIHTEEEIKNEKVSAEMHLSSQS